MMKLTLKERERLAYIEGNVELAKVLGALADALRDADYGEIYDESENYYD